MTTPGRLGVQGTVGAHQEDQGVSGDLRPKVIVNGEEVTDEPTMYAVIYALANENQRLHAALKMARADALIEAADQLEANAHAYRKRMTWRPAKSKREEGRNKKVGHMVGAEISVARWLRRRAKSAASPLDASLPFGGLGAH